MNSNKMKSLSIVAVVAIAAISIAGTQNKYFEIAKNIEIFANAYKELNTYYVDDIDPAKLMRIGIDAMTESLDPFTNYISEADIEGYRIQSTGKYGGIGFRSEVHEDGLVTIVEIYNESPAEKAKLSPGDVVLKADGRSIKGKNDEELSDLLKGSPGTKLTLTVRKAGSAKEENIDITREEIKIPNVPYSGMITDNIGYVNLTTFTEDAGENVGKAVRELKAKNQLKGIVLDLRDNGGGLLTEAVNVVNTFVGKDVLTVSMRSKVKEWDKDFKTQNGAIDADVPVTVLMNHRSASASEIVSGALQDLDRAVIIGEKSYGKGLVQNTKDVGYGSRLKLTTAKYYIPSGRCIQAVYYRKGEAIEIADSLKNSFKTKNLRVVYDGGGIIPDVKVETTKSISVIQALLKRHLIFDYATQYRLAHPTITGTAKDFRLTDADYQDFILFITKANINYDTEVETLLKQLEDKAKAAKQDALLQTDLAAMRTKLATEKRSDLTKYKSAIKAIIEKEIVGRYFAQKGKIEQGLQVDEEVREAVKLLNDVPRYKQILKMK